MIHERRNEMADYGKEVKEYLEKTKAQIGAIDKILEINSYGLIEHDITSQLEVLKKKAAILMNKLQNNEFEIAIVGMEKAGKSSFANALMGNDILPSKDARCTYTSTSIRFGNDEATVNFYSRDEFETNFQEKLGILKVPHAEALSFQELSLERYQSIFEQLDEEKKRLYGGTVNQDIENILRYKNTISKYLGMGSQIFRGAQDLEGNNFKRFIENAEYAIAVKEITLNSSRLDNMKNAVIYDVPGFDSPTQMHKDQTIEKMRLADVIVLIVSAFQPSFTGPLVDIFRKESDYDGVRFGDKMFVFANKADMANTLNDNIVTIQRDLSKHSIMDNSKFDRIVPGSARAKLEEEGKLEGTKSIDALRSQGISSGIDEIKEKLEYYNQTDRFDILKARINRIQTDIYNVFKEMVDRQKEIQAPNILPTSYGRENIQLLMFAQKKIKEKLEEYRNHLRVKFTSELAPLTNKMKEQVISNITVENYQVTDEELIKAANENVLVSDMQQSQDIERNIRKKKYLEIYNAFSTGVVNMAVDEHNQCDQEIVKIFLEGLDVNETNVYYEQIKENVLAYIKNYKVTRDDKGYYKSLVQRFSVDLFEILIELSFGGVDRWRKFAKERSDFYSLTMFDAGGDLTASPDKQPLLYAILFHDRERSAIQQYSKDIIEFLQGSLEIVTDSKIIALVKMISKIKKVDALQCIEEMFKSTDRNKDKEAKYNIVLNSLESKIDVLKRDGADLTDISLDEESYDQYFNGKRDKDLDQIKQEIDEDIEILQSALQNVVLNAICMEKTFKAVVFQTIENLIKSLQKEKEFGKLVYDNSYFIKTDDFSKLDEENSKQMAYANIMKEINTIIGELKQGTNEMEE